MPEFVQTAIEIAQQAGLFLKEAQQSQKLIEFEEKRNNDLVTEYDRQADQMISSLIKQHYPEHGI